MSGFFGMIREDGSSVDERLLERIAEELRVRGPDGTQIWTEEGKGGCFTLLRTEPGRQAERQPVFLDGKNWLLGDVRLDARKELLAVLEADGEGATGEEHSSETLLLRAWEKWGEASLPRMMGDFSFALWDARENALWCARDFVGPRPFYCAHVRGAFCFSNTLQTLLQMPEVSRELDELFLGDFLLQGHCSHPERTVYKEIRRLPPGHVLKLASGEIRVQRFLKLPIEEPLRFQHPQEYVEQYRAELRGAVADRLPTNGASLYLSGGLDSSAVCAVAAQIAHERGEREQLKAFTISWRPLLKDEESNYARMTAAHLQIAQEILEEETPVAFEEREPGATQSPEPLLEPFFERARREFRRVAGHRPVVLGGEGGDDVLTGQSWPFLVSLCKRAEWAQLATTFGSYLWSHGKLPPLRGGFRGKLRRLVNRENVLEGYPAWMEESFEKRAGLKQRWRELAAEPEQEHPIHPSAYASLHRGYWGSVLETEDAGWTGVALEPRAPLLDLRLIRFLLRVPPVPWCIDKELGRRAMEGLLPPTVLHRPKSPLIRDPLEVIVSEGRWRPEPPIIPVDAVHRFVKWQKYCATLEMLKGSKKVGDFRPLQLALWLKVVEMGGGVK